MPLSITNLAILLGATVLFISWYKRGHCFTCGVKTYFNPHRHCMRCDVLYCSTCAKDHITEYIVNGGTLGPAPIGMKCKECTKPKLVEIYRKLCLIKLQRLWMHKMYSPDSAGYNKAHTNFTSLTFRS